jgi:hypothetical protein
MIVNREKATILKETALNHFKILSHLSPRETEKKDYKPETL